MGMLTERNESFGKKLFTLLAEQGQHLGWQELLMLKSAWQGKLTWEELPDDLRTRFVDVAYDLAIGVARTAR